jgi:hypothetical protein
VYVSLSAMVTVPVRGVAEGFAETRRVTTGRPVNGSLKLAPATVMNGALLTTVNVQSGEFVRIKGLARPPSPLMLVLARPGSANDTLVHGTAPEAVEDGRVVDELSEQAPAQIRAVASIEATARPLQHMKASL